MPRKFKLCLLGGARVGKTALVKQLLDTTFSEDYIKTEGHTKRDYNIPGMDVTLQLYDLSHHERYEDRFSNIVKGAAVILMCDATNDESFENVKLWLDLVNSLHPHKRPPVYFVVNKCDGEHAAKVLDGDMQFYVAAHKLEHRMISVKDRPYEIQALLNDVVNACLEVSAKPTRAPAASSSGIHLLQAYYAGLLLMHLSQLLLKQKKLNQLNQLSQ